MLFIPCLELLTSFRVTQNTFYVKLLFILDRNFVIGEGVLLFVVKLGIHLLINQFAFLKLSKGVTQAEFCNQVELIIFNIL